MVISKQQMLENMSEGIKTSKSFVFTEYQGLKVSEMEELRKELKKLNARYHVAKNTILSLAFKNAGIGDASKGLVGTTGIIFIKNEDPSAPLKKLIDFSKEHEKLKIKNGYFFGKVVSSSEIKKIASLPSKEALLEQFLGILNMRIGSFIGILNAPLQRLVYALNQIEKNKQKQ